MSHLIIILFNFFGNKQKKSTVVARAHYRVDATGVQLHEERGVDYLTLFAIVGLQRATHS